MECSSNSDVDVQVYCFVNNSHWMKYVHCLPKKEATWCLIITLANVDRFSKFFHQLNREKILYV